MDKNEIIKYINLSKKANTILYGIDIIKKTKQKIYLIIQDKESGLALKKSTQFIVNEKQIPFREVESLNEIINTENCKVAGFTNENLAKIINSKF